MADDPGFPFGEGAGGFAVKEVQLAPGGAAESVGEHEQLCAEVGVQIVEQVVDGGLGELAREGHAPPADALFAVDSDADLDLVRAEREGRPSGHWRGAGGQREADAA